MITPGVSKNGRLYSIPALENAADRLRTRIKEGNAPVTMMTHHAAGDDSTAVVGKVTKVSLQPDGTIKYEADIADTTNGRDIAALAKDGYLPGVSIRGYWAAPPRVEEYQGQSVETADDIEIVGLDFTKNPGVNGARVDSVVFESADGLKKQFFESAEAEIEVEEDEVPHLYINGECATCLTEGKDALTPGSNYADPGYQADKKKRYPLDTKAHVKAAWSYINMPKNAKAYTSAQLKRIKSKIMAAAKKFGININESTAERVAETIKTLKFAQEVLEAYGSICLSTDSATINVSTYVSQAEDLPAAAIRAAQGALAALLAVDPDNDGDIDLDDGNLTLSTAGIPRESVSEDSDEDGVNNQVPGPAGDIPKAVQNCAHCKAGVPADCVECPNCGYPVAESVSQNTSDTEDVNEVTTETETQESQVAEETNEATETAAEAPAAVAVDVKAEVATAVAEAMKVALPEMAKALVEALAPKTEVAETAATEATADEVQTDKPVTEEAPAAPAPSISEEDVQNRINTAVAEAMTEMRKSVIESYGPPRRKGFVTETGASAQAGARKPLWEMSDAEFRAASREAAELLVPGVPPTALVVDAQ